MREHTRRLTLHCMLAVIAVFSAPLPAPAQEAYVEDLYLAGPLFDCVRDMVFSPDGSTMVCASSQGEVVVWDTATWTAKRTLLPKAMYLKPDDRRGPGVAPYEWCGVDWLSYSADGSTLMALRRPRVLFVWDTATWNASQRTEAGVCIVPSPDGRTLAWWRSDVIELVDPSTWACKLTIDWDSRLVPLAFSPDGTKLVLSTGDGLELWSANSGKRLCALSADPPTGFSADGTKLLGRVFGDRRYHLAWHDPRTGELCSASDGFQIMVGDDVAFSRDGKVLALYVGNGVVVLDGQSLRTVRSFEIRPSIGDIKTIALSPDGRFVVLGTSEMERLGLARIRPSGIAVYDMTSGEELAVRQVNQGDERVRKVTVPTPATQR